LNRFDLAKGVDPPKDIPEPVQEHKDDKAQKRVSGRPDIRNLGELQFGIPYQFEINGHLYQGFISDLNMSRGVHSIQTIGGPRELVPDRSMTLTLNMTIDSMVVPSSSQQSRSSLGA